MLSTSLEVYGFPWSKIAIMHLVYISTFCITVVFDFSWNDCTTQEKLETMVIQFFFGGYGEVNKVKHGLCGNGGLSFILHAHVLLSYEMLSF